ncbi:CatB-related O-acetyltransferase [Pararoseomonas sp. SCSIO 73927]|uniref:CatB-related O-acetyltransferase n=1 Tax=Pararoseomonas sp. SCSIO 73927 TaxID=3114537 RepID=UPI0030CDB448
MIVTEELLRLFDKARIFTEKAGPRRFRLGSSLIVARGARLEGYSEIFSGNVLPASAGAFSYSHSPFKAFANLGRYCSIAGGVTVMGADHPHEWVTTSPFTYRPTGHPAVVAAYEDHGRPIETARAFRFRGAKNSLNIGHDVWIAGDVLLRQGISIGHGAVIAGGSVVTKDVPPFAIVGGVPARVIRLRFPEAIVERLLALEWWRFHPAVLQELRTDDVAAFLGNLEAALDQGSITPFDPGYLEFADPDGLPILHPASAVNHSAAEIAA